MTNNKPETIYTIDMIIQKILDEEKQYDLSKIISSYEFAAKAHANQVRSSGEPYITHPLAVAYILLEFGMDTDTICAALLHDVVEDTDVTLDEIKKLFGQDVAMLVDGVTKLGKIPLFTREEQQAENVRKILLAMSQDIRVIIIKLCDRLHNMRTLQYRPAAKQRNTALETMNIYAPIANRLGMKALKDEIEDIAFRYLDPYAYSEIERMLEIRSDKREAFIESIKAEIAARFKEENFGSEPQIDGRVKSIYGIYKKAFIQGKSFDEIYDKYAVRIIVNTVAECYNALGIIHDMFRPIPNRFKDYIATPKANMYQSLHTTVIGSEGIPFEVQIRTWEMHHTAEYGIAAHWKYKEASNNGGAAAPMTVTEEEKLSWLRQILEWQRDMSDNKEFMSLLKSDLDLFSDTVFCFTPTGDVKNLPNGSTPIDFAYSIHSAVGNKMIGAKVNGKLVPIDYVIQNGDRIEVLTSQNSKGPSRDWLNIVKSTQAKNKINQWFRSELKEENIVRGKELLASCCKSKGINLSDINRPEYQDKIMRKYGFHDWNSCLATVGHGGLKEGQIVNRMYEEYKKDHLARITDEEVLETISENKEKVPEKKSKSGIIVKGLYDVAVHFSKCCSPVPGDEIVGFVTRGRGVSIHRTDCINIINLSDMERERLIDAEWQHDEESGNSGLYLAEIKVFCNNRTGLLVDITRAFTERAIDINAIHSKTSKQGIATIDISFNTKGKAELTSVIDKLRQIDSIIDIERTTG